MMTEAPTATTTTESKLEKILTDGQFAVTAELGPPKSCDVELVKKKAAILHDVVDAVNITDNQTAIVRMSSIAAGKIAQDCGCEVVMQMTCRDRNLLAIQADILGAYALGIKNILCLTGDHQCFGDHAGSRSSAGLSEWLTSSPVARSKSQISGFPVRVE